MHSDKVVLITGGCGNVGKCLIERMKGHSTLICCDVSEKIYDYEDISLGVYAIQCDLTNIEILHKKLIELSEKGIEINQAILAHGKIAYGKIENTSYLEFQDMIESNLSSFFLVLKELIPYFKKNGGGDIVVLSSQFAKTAAYDLMAYCTSKAALKHLVKCIALDYAEDGIIINSVSPGIMAGKMNDEISKNYENLNVNWKLLTSRMPIREILVQDVVDSIIFLINQKSVTGTDLIIDGGFTIR